ncbi:MAG TPA: S8 family serine peptidase, partial [Blastocatellia bacterium]|nr:S8 family serine peptidase [Blastocatellia bacterium]
VDTALTALNGGQPVSGLGNFSVVINDSGVDATHNDLKFGPKVIQNVQIITDAGTDSDLDGLIADEAEFTPLTAVENVPNTDQSVGHGTHCAGIIGGTGERSGGRYQGVAPGAKLIGSGLGAGLLVLGALGTYEWSMANQFIYNIRVISNSFGSRGDFNPDDPIHIASRALYERNVVIVFSASNSGPGKDSLNRYGKAPWVIAVANGTKEGGLDISSSRGLPREERLTDDNPLNDFNAPTITAPGTGREFTTSAARLTTDIVATRSTSNLVANGLDADLEIPPAYLPFYTQISGTSMACPFISGTVALMLDADPTLTPDEVKQILRETATRVPNREDWEVGAGFVNAWAAVDKVFNRNKNYGTFREPEFNAEVAVQDRTQNFTIDYSPANTVTGSGNTAAFAVEEGTDLLDVFALIPLPPPAGSDDGSTANTLRIRLKDPQGVIFDSPIALPLLNAANRQVIVKKPRPGAWTVEVRGYNTYIGHPTTVTGVILKRQFTPAPVVDLQGHTLEAAIGEAIEARKIDIFADGTFRPGDSVTRADFARVLTYSTPVRQKLGNAVRFTDVASDFAAIAEAVTSNGSTLRDLDFTPAGMMTAAGSSFNPSGAVSRVDLAVAFVRALGLDTEAKARAGATVTSNGSPLIDGNQIPAALRGYVQIAIDKGLLEVYPASVRQIGPGQFEAVPGPRVEPNRAVTRAELAVKVMKFDALYTNYANLIDKCAPCQY